MKTIEKVKQEMAELEEADKKVDSPGVGQHRRKRQHKINIHRYEFLRSVLLLLEHNPTEAFLESQREEIESRIKVISDRYLSYIEDRARVNVTKVQYMKKMEVPELRKQLKNLNYILN